MKIIVAPDKFKGSLTSFEVCKAISAGIKKWDPSIEVVELAMADGGDGFAAIMKHYLTTDTLYCDTVDALGRNITVSYQWNEKRRTAIIEMAVASGLVLLNEQERNPLLTSSIGTGLLIKDAIGRGAAKIILGLGGSATNDGGTGILAALGFQFVNEHGDLLPASGKSLLAIKKIIAPSFIPVLKLEIACDVQNVLYGPQGAAYVYAPQKGASREQVQYLDKGLKNFAAVIKEQTRKDISTIAGTGAAGGIAAGLLPFFDVRMKKGIELIIAASKIKRQLTDASLLITGEGKIDEQSSAGKVVGYMAGLAKQYDIPCVALCGVLQLGKSGLNTLGLQHAIAISDGLVNKEEAMKNASELLIKKMPGILDFLQHYKKE